MNQNYDRSMKLFMQPIDRCSEETDISTQIDSNGYHIQCCPSRKRDKK